MTKIFLHWEESFFSLAEVFRDKQGVWTLRRVSTCPLLPKDERVRSEEALKQVQTLLHSWQLPQTTLHCLLPASKIFLRTASLEIPSGLEKTRLTLVKWKAKKIFPAPLEKLVWNFQLFPLLQKKQVHIAYVATKMAFIAPLLKIISKAKPAQTISAVPCVLYNALQLANQGQEPCLVIDAGASTVTLIFIKAETFLSSYTLSQFASLEKDICALLKHLESKYAVPKKIFFTGALRHKQQLLSLLEKSVTIPLYDLDLLLEKHLIITSEQTANLGSDPQNPYSISLLVGGIDIAQKESIELNLLPPPLLEAQQKKEQRRYFLGTIAVLLFTFLLWSFHLFVQTSHLTTVITQIEYSLTQEQKKLTRVHQALGDLKEIEQETAALTSLIKAHAAWPQLIQELQNALPERYLWITKLTPVFYSENSTEGPSLHASAHQNTSSIRSITLEGLYLENPHQADIVTVFLEQLQQSPFFVITDQEKALLSCAPATGTAYAYPFKLLLPLQSPITLGL